MIGRLAVSVIAVLLAVSGVPWAGEDSEMSIRGTVLDSAGEPIAGASVCFMAAMTEQRCTETNEDGSYEIEKGVLQRIRIYSPGYLPLTVAAQTRDEPFVLERSASVRIRVKDSASGEWLSSSRGWVIMTSGRRREFVANRAGSIVSTLKPGTVRVVAEADGYAGSDAYEVLLEAGEEAAVVIEVEPLRPGSEAETP